MTSPDKKQPVFKWISESNSSSSPLVVDGVLILQSFDEVADTIRNPRLTQAIVNLEFQVRRSDGTWVSVDADRVRIAPKGMK